MRRPVRLDALRRQNLRKSMDVRKGMPSMLPENPAHSDPSTMRAGDGVQGTVTFDVQRVVTAEEAALQFSGDVGEDGSGLIVVLSECTIETPGGMPFDRGAVVRIGGPLARDLAARSRCLSQRAFLIHGRLVMRSDGPGSYDLAAFSGTSPRKAMRA